MPKALPHDIRSTAAALHAQGWNPSQIASKLNLSANTVTQWSIRYRWKLARDNSTAVMTANGDRGLAVSLAERSAALRSKLADTFTSDVEHFSNIPRRNGLQVLKLHAQAEPLVRNCAKVGGWEPGVQVQVGVVADLDSLTLSTEV